MHTRGLVAGIAILLPLPAVADCGPGGIFKDNDYCVYVWI